MRMSFVFLVYAAKLDPGLTPYVNVRVRYVGTILLLSLTIYCDCEVFISMCFI